MVTYLVCVVLIFLPLLLLKASIIIVPKNKIGMYYNYFTGSAMSLEQGTHFSPNYILYVKWLNHLQDNYTHLVDIRNYSDPIVNYQVLTDSQLKLLITGKAMIRMIDPVKAYNSTTDLDQIIDSLCKAELRNCFSKVTAKQIIQSQDLLQTSLTERLNLDLKDHGAIVEKFIINKVDLPPQLIRAVELTTAKESEHRCKLLDIENQKLLSAAQIEISNMKCEAKRSRRWKQVEEQIKARELFNNVKLEHLQKLKTKGVNLDQYLKYQNYKKGGANLVVTG